MFEEKTREVRTGGTLVQTKVGNKIRQHLETTDWNSMTGKETITKIPLPDMGSTPKDKGSKSSSQKPNKEKK